MKDYFRALLSSAKLNTNESKKVLYVIDANYLLYSVQTSIREQYYIEALEKNIDNLYIPFNVYIEFLSNFQSFIERTKKFLASTSTVLDGVKNIENVVLDKEWIQHFLLSKLEEFSAENSLKKNAYNSLTQHSSYKLDVSPQIEGYIDEILNNISEPIKLLNSGLSEAAKKLKVDSEEFNVNKYNSKMEAHLKKLNYIFNYEGVLGKACTKWI